MSDLIVNLQKPDVRAVQVRGEFSEISKFSSVISPGTDRPGRCVISGEKDF